VFLSHRSANIVRGSAEQKTRLNSATNSSRMQAAD
jgi:hypothetical protein